MAGAQTPAIAKSVWVTRTTLGAPDHIAASLNVLFDPGSLHEVVVRVGLGRDQVVGIPAPHDVVGLQVCHGLDHYLRSEPWPMKLT